MNELYEEQKEKLQFDLFKTISVAIAHAVDLDRKSVQKDLNYYNQLLAQFRDLIGEIDDDAVAEKVVEQSDE